MENNITKILIKNSGKGVTLPLNSWKRGYGPPPLVLTFTDDPPLWGPSPPPLPPGNVPSLSIPAAALDRLLGKFFKGVDKQNDSILSFQIAYSSYLPLNRPVFFLLKL